MPPLTSYRKSCVWCDPTNFASKPLEFGVFRAFYRAELVRCRVVESEPWLAAPVALTDLII